MGSGHFPELGAHKACYISQMELLDEFGRIIYPGEKDLMSYVSKSECYRLIYCGDKGGRVGSYMFFGGPPDCEIK